MLTVNRNRVVAPASLYGERAQPARDALLELFSEDQRRIAQTRAGMWSLLVDDPLLDQGLLELFGGRCAFCETPRPTFAYRFRPPEEAGPRDAAPPDAQRRAHLYYSWLANAWQNIYSICDLCQPDEPSFFPVRGSRMPLPSEAAIRTYVAAKIGHWPGAIRERNLLLDPCSGIDLRRHLAFVPDGSVLALSLEGDTTIKQFKLMRDELVERRRSAFALYREQLIANDAELAPQVFDFAKREHGGAWYLLLYALVRLAEKGVAPRAELARSRIKRSLASRWTQPKFRRRFALAWDQLQEDPFQLVETPPKPIPMASHGPRPVQLIVRNFKALEHVEVSLAPVLKGKRPDPSLPAPSLMILGENAAGKSSLLEAMTLALTDEADRRALQLDPEEFMLDPMMMGEQRRRDRLPGAIAVTFEDGHSVELGFDERGFRSAHAPLRDEVRIPVFAYGAYRLFVERQPGAGAAANIRSLFEPRQLLGDPETWLYSIRGMPLFDEVARALRPILALGQAFERIDVDQTLGRCMLVFRSERVDAGPVFSHVPLSTISSGFRAVLGMACDVMRNLDARDSATTLAETRAVVLLDEIEAHLHPRWKMQIMAGLREALPNVMFIVTTHDPLCLRGMDAGEVRVLRRRARAREEGGDLPMVVEQVEDLPPIGALTIEQLLTSDLFQLFSTDADTLEASLANVGDLLARGPHDAGPDHAARLAAVRQQIERDIARSLPIGSTEVQRLVQEAVEDYLRRRRAAPAAALAQLKAETRERIIAALGRA